MFHPKCEAAADPDEIPAPKTVDSRSNSTKSYNYFKSAQWSADGTSLLALSADNAIQTYIVPPDLLEKRGEPLFLDPYCTIKSFEPVNVAIGYPLFNLQEPSTTLVLSSMREHPVRLHSALNGHLGASYPLVNPMTEAYISPTSMIFLPDGSRFVAGSESLISVFDLSRPGEGAMASIATGPKKKHSDFNATTNMRGIVSALAVDQSSNILAAGTYSRQVALYESSGQGECVGVFSVCGNEADSHIRGSGVTQLHWSPCGRYLYISERKSDGIMVYDIRVTGHLLAWLEGRDAQTNQRLGVDISASPAEEGHEIWAGGLDGKIRQWKNPQQNEGAVLPTFGYKGCDDAVSSVAVHRTGGVLVTTSGQRHFDAEVENDEEDTAGPEPSLKIWSL